MFFNNFREDDLSILRMCNLSSRFRDCAALLSINYISKLLGLTIPDLCEWVLVEIIGDEICRMMMKDQETNINDSYMPYLMDLYLSQKSPYSAAANPNIYTWIHTVGNCFKSERSKNANALPDACLTSPITNAQLMAFAFSKRAGLTKVMSSNEASGELRNMGCAETVYPSTTDANSWLAWFNESPNGTPRELIDFSHGVWASLKNCKGGTIGEYLHNLATRQAPNAE